LGAFLKVAGAVATGGEAKWAVQSGDVAVNGVVETRRGHRLSDRDVVTFAGVEYRVCISVP
jgi:ribosome-associated protein